MRMYNLQMPELLYASYSIKSPMKFPNCFPTAVQHLHTRTPSIHHEYEPTNKHDKEELGLKVLYVVNDVKVINDYQKSMVPSQAPW